jgi:hypothetical protein
VFDEETHSYQSTKNISVTIDDDALRIVFPKEAIEAITYPHLGGTALRVSYLESESDDWYVELRLEYGGPKLAAECNNRGNYGASDIDYKYILDQFEAVIWVGGKLEWHM